METSYSGKPYGFIPFTDQTSRNEPVSHQGLLSSGECMGKLAVTISCVTPLHFGSGEIRLNERANHFVHSLLREKDEIVLPGSSFKGMLRSVFEAVTVSCVLQSPVKDREQVRIGQRSKCSKSEQCPACSVFGRLSYKGKLIFSSFSTSAAPIEMVIPSLERPFKTYPRPRMGVRDPGTGNERLYYGAFSDLQGLEVAAMSKQEFWDRKRKEPKSGGKFYGRKFYKHSSKWDTLVNSNPTARNGDFYECLPEKSILEGTISYQGLTKEELGALLFALGLGWEKPIYHKLGYAKPAFLGSVELKIESQTLPRYETEAIADLEQAAKAYFELHKESIGAAVNAIEDMWSQKGDSMWSVQPNGRYGY